MKNSQKSFFVSLNIGNTNLSLCRSDTEVFFHSHADADNLRYYLQSWLSEPRHPYLLVCNVLSLENFQQKFPDIYSLIKNYSHQLDYLPYWHHHHFFSMPVRYSSTLGQDRLVQAYLLWKQLQQHQLLKGLIVDAGTMTTIDVISSQEGFLGGYILPGLDSYASIFGIAKKLPAKEDILACLNQTIVSTTLPSHTLEAICSSYWHSYKALIAELHQQYAFQKIIISGGHALQWKKNLAFYSTSLTEDHLFPHRALWQIGSDMLELKTL